MQEYKFNYTAAPTIAAFMRSEAFFRLLIGPVGGGKSVGCVIELFRQALQMSPCPDGKRRSRFIIIRNTRQQLKDTTIKTFLDWVKPGVFGRWKESEMVFEMRFQDVEADFMFRPLDSPEDIQRVLSLEGTASWINEAREIDLEILQAIMSRVGRYPKREDVPQYRSFVIADTNPPEIDDTWYKIAEKMPLEEDNENSVMLCDTFFQPSGLSATAENVENLRPGYYEDLSKGKTKEWVDVYIHGKYSTSKAGKPVYHNCFSLERHVSKTPLVIDPALPVIVGFDTGLTPALLFQQVTLDGRVRTLREIAAFDMGMQRCVSTHIRPMIRNYFHSNPLIFVGDPAAVRRGDGDESTAMKELKTAFSDDGAVVKTASTNDPRVRIQATEYMLTTYPNGEPLKLIDPSCHRYTKGLRSMYRYQRIQGNRGYSDVPQKSGEPGTFAHLVEAGQYGDLFIQSGRYLPGDYMRRPADPYHFMSQPTYRPAQREGY